MKTKLQQVLEDYGFFQTSQELDEVEAGSQAEFALRELSPVLFRSASAREMADRIKSGEFGQVVKPPEEI